MQTRSATITASLVAATLSCCGASPDANLRSLGLTVSTNVVGMYETAEFTLAPPLAQGDPFDPDQLSAEVVFKTPSGQALTIPAFYMQDYERVRAGQQGRDKDWCYPVGRGSWRARFAPMEPGAYEAVAQWRDAEGTLVSAPVPFTCGSSDRPGFLRPSKRDPRYLEFSSGRPFFGLGQNLAFIGNQQYVTPSKAEDIVARLSQNGANYLRVWTGCEDWAIGIEARKSAWGRSWSWHPPFARCPDNTNRWCVRLAGGATVRADPSHRVALRPETRYVLSGRLMFEGDVRVRLLGPHAGPGRATEVAPPQQWAPFRHEFTTGPTEFWLEPPALRAEGTGTAYLDRLSLTEAQGGPELLWEADVNRPVRGFYNPLDCFLVDELVKAAERHGVYLQLCLLTRDVYMSDLKNVASVEYARAIADAKKFMRFAVARWGSATSVAAWEYWNEMDPGLPTDRFYTELGQFLDQVDIYRHLRTTSTWGPSAKDCRHPQLDMADTHFYLRPSDRSRLEDEVAAVLDRTRWLREQAPARPAHLGEFGLANDKWQPTTEMESSLSVVDFHNALWASALSGASTTALFWWWDRLDRRDHYREYKPLSQFVADVPWTSGALEPIRANCVSRPLRIVGLRSDRSAWLWLFDPAASWSNVVVAQRVPEPVSGAVVDLIGLPPGSYQVKWFNPRDGRVIAEQTVGSESEQVRLEVPAFAADVAARVTPVQRP